MTHHGENAISVLDVFYMLSQWPKIQSIVAIIIHRSEKVDADVQIILFYIFVFSFKDPWFHFLFVYNVKERNALII